MSCSVDARHPEGTTFERLQWSGLELAEDADRYAREMEEFKQSNPGWVKWHEAQLELEKKVNGDKKPAKPAARKPRAPLTPWMAYVKSQVQKRLSADPSLKPGLQLTVRPPVLDERIFLFLV